MSEPNGEVRTADAGAEEAADAATGTAMVDPAPPEEFIEAARLAPNHWLYLIDPAWSGDGPPPEWAVVGQWRSDFDGEIVEWQDNEDYRPSPGAMGWPEPTDEVDAAIQLATTGYGPAEDVTSALGRAEVAVLVTAEGDPVRASAPDGTPVIPVYTSPQYLHLAGRLGFEQVKAREFLDRIPEGYSLCLNSSAPVSMVLHTDGLEEAMDRAEAEPGSEPETAPASGSATGPRTPSVDDWPLTMSTEDIGSATANPANLADPVDPVDGEPAGEHSTEDAPGGSENSEPGSETTP
ncbi:type VII secretion system-associated protein [Streptomyces sp. GESEQ-35]|uniref:type VII secretion system-associated protein n=1 Tax=Streptomyces sp. GESEQ-35 TaxID=2812657 RepID=UPI001B33C55E|nr:type VII secretion system-associated protein [Streptomyces sp. GESEQ-35]